MKKLLLIVLLVMSAFMAANAQYIVTKVSGRVRNSAGEYIRPGSQLKGDERLSWSSLKDKLWVVIIGKGEKVISPSPDATPDENVFTQLLASSLHTDSRSGSLSGRGEIIEKIPDALHTDAKSNGKVIIEDSGKYLFDTQLFPQTDGSTFFIEIDEPQKDPVIRVLKTQDDTLFIKASDLATETVNADIKYTLGYHNKTAADKNQLVATFTPYFDLTNEMKSTIANTILAYMNTDAKMEAVRDSVYLNVYANLGKPNGILFMYTFNKYWLTKGVNAKKDEPQGATGALYNDEEFKSVPVLSALAGLTRDELPSNYSLQQYAPPVGFQGSFGSCTAWSTSYAARTISYAIQHDYSVNNQYDKIIAYSFSPNFIYDNINDISSNPDCTAGTSIPKALAFMKVNGDIRQKKGDYFKCGKSYSSDDLDAAKAYRIKDFLRVNDANVSNHDLVQRIKSLIVSKHPLPFGMVLPATFRAVDQSGILYPTEAERRAALEAKRGHQSYEGHAMCVVGYNDNINNGSFEIMNSWGSWAANKGYYWINYDDFCDFVVDIYSINDFNTDAPPVIIAAKTDTPVVIKPLVVIPVKTVTQPLVVVSPLKPRLKGNLEFMLLKADGDYETMPVNKNAVDVRGQVVEGDNTSHAGYADYALAKPMYSGSKYKIKLNLSESAYVYVIGMDKTQNTTLFPLHNESALIDFDGATLVLPGKDHHIVLDNETGKEKTCVLISKSPIDIAALNQKYADGEHNFFQDVKDFLPGRLIEMRSGSYLDNRIAFDTAVKDNDVVAFFVEFDHL